MTSIARHKKGAAPTIESQEERPEEEHLRDSKLVTLPTPLIPATQSQRCTMLKFQSTAFQPSRRTILSWTLWAICWYLNGMYVMPLVWDDLAGQHSQVQEDNFRRFGTSWLVNFWGTGTNWVVSWAEKAVLLLLVDKVMGRRI